MFQMKGHATSWLRWKEKALSVLNGVATSVGSLPSLIFFVVVVGAMLLRMPSKKGIKAQLFLKT